MATETGEKKKVRWYKKLRNKYRLVLMNDETLEERLTFRLSRLNVFVATGTVTIVLIVLTSYLIAFTPLREYIPGYTNIGLKKKLYELQIKTDSVEKELTKKDLFLKNLQAVINGQDLQEDRPVVPDTTSKYSNIRNKKSEDDSLLRAEIESQANYSLRRQESVDMARKSSSSIGGVLFFTPLKGVVTGDFNPAEKHFGVDIVAKQNDAIKAVLDGTVLFSDWTVKTGYVIVLQHTGNIISIYKHNSALLKHSGDVVKAGEPIAIVGESGELTTGPHLHLEIWSDGSPVNPKDYISF